MKITAEIVRGQKRHVVDYGTFRGRRVRRYYSSAKGASEAVKRARAAERMAGSAWAARPERERAEILGILAEMDREGVRLADLWSAWRAGILAPGSGECPLGRAIDEVVRAKRVANRTDRYVRSLEELLRKFASGREQQPVHRIGAQDIEAWFDAHPGAPSTKVANAGRLSALFSYCMRRGYCRDNPVGRLERVTVEARAPVILSPKQARVLMRFAQRKTPSLLGYFALCLFAGVRPEEAQALTWAAVDLKAGTVRLDKTKVRRRRIVELPPNAAAWLAVCKPRRGPVVSSVSTLRRARRRIRNRLRLDWRQDILRHTAASYLLAIHRDPVLVADMLGNSPKMLLRHYKQLVGKEDATAWEAIRP